MEFSVAFQVDVNALLLHVRLVNHETLSANLPESMQRLGRAKIDIAVAKSTLDSLLKHLRYVKASRATKNGNRSLSGLCNVKEIVEQRLPRMGGKHVKLVQDENHRL